MNDLICIKLKQIIKLQEIIKKDDINYKAKRGKTYNFGKYSLPIIFLRDIHNGYLSLEKADNNQSNFAYNCLENKQTLFKLRVSIIL